MWTIPAQAPLTVPAVLLALGALVGSQAALEASSCGVALCLAVAVLTRATRVAALALAAGLLAGQQAAPGHTTPSWLGSVSDGLYVLEGRVESAPPPTRYTQRMTLDVERIGEGSTSVAMRVRAYLRARRGVFPTAACVPGARIRLIARVSATGRSRGRLRGSVWSREGVTVLASAGVVERALQPVRLHVAETFDRHLRFRDAGLARAVVAGDRARLASSDRILFQQADQVHLLAVSGMHVALVIGGLLALLRLLGVPLVASHVIGLLGIAFYVPFTGASPSSLRAGLGAALYLIAPLIGRTARGLAVIPAIVVLAFVVDPLAFTRLGLWLSLAAVLGILVLAPPLTDTFVPRPLHLPGLRAPRGAWFRRGLAVGFGAWCATLPIVAGEIGRMCLLAAPLSVLAAPFLVVLVGSAILLLAVSAVPVLADSIAVVFAHTADGLRLLLDLPRHAYADASRVGAPSVGWHVAYALTLYGIARGTERHRVYWLALAMLLAAALLLDEPTAAPSAARGYDAAPTAPPIRTEEPMTGIPLLIAAGGLLAFALFAVRPTGWLTPAGAAGAWVLGVAASWQFGWQGLVALLATFLATTLMSKLPGRHRSGARTLRQVIANGAGPMAGCVLAALGFPVLGGGAFLGGLAFLGADTTSSEIGVRYGGPPRRLFRKETIAPGQSGGITLVGSVAGALGGLIPPLVFAVLTTFHLGAILWIGLAGLLGGIVDSVLGDTVQFRGTSPETGSITEVREVNGVAMEHHSGLPWLDNDAVNLVCGLVAAALGAIFIHLA